jgi:hypothetical protein
MSTLTLFDWTPPPLQPIRFNGPEYSEADDRARLTGQIYRVRALMLDGAWRTVSEIHAVTKDPEPSISAQLRHLRKVRFGSHIVERRARGNRESGLFEYRLLLPDAEDVSAPLKQSASQTIAALRAENAELKRRIALLSGSEVCEEAGR